MEVQIPPAISQIRELLPILKGWHVGPRSRYLLRNVESTAALWQRFVESVNKAGTQAAEEALEVGARALRKLAEAIEAGNVV